MDRNVVKIIQDRAEQILRAGFAADPMLKHFTVTFAGGTIGGVDATLKFLFLDTSATPLPVNPLTGDHNKDIQLGLASAGTEVVYAGKTYTIIHARQKKYLAQAKENGKNYLIRFEGCQLVKKDAS